MEKKSRLRTGRPTGLKVQYYKKIAQSMALKIKNGTWPDGYLLPSYLKLAATFRVGELTIRRALECLVQEQRIVKNSRRQWIVKKNDKVCSFQDNGIVLIASHVLSSFLFGSGWAQIRRGIELRIAEGQVSQFRIYFRDKYNTSMRSALVPGLKDADVSGVLLLGHYTKNCLQQYSMLGVPVVRVDAPSPMPTLASISVDNEAAAEDAVLRLVQLGHRRIAFCRFIVTSILDIDPDSKERQAGFLAGLEKSGINHGKRDIFSFMGSSGAVTLNAILNARPRYTAVVAVDSGIAESVELAALQAGWVLPRDLSIVAFTPAGSNIKFSGPQSDFENMGRKAVELLQSREVRQIRVPAAWHEGSTLAKAP